MIVEQLIFTIIAFVLFVFTFFKMIRKNETDYIIVLIIQALGIAFNFVEVLLKKELSPLLTIIKYLFGILVPIGIIILERKKIPLLQVSSVLKAKLYVKMGNNKKAKEQLINLVSVYPENYIGHKMLAEIYESEGGMRKAIDEYVQAIDINKKDYDSYFRVAELLNNLDKTDLIKDSIIYIDEFAGFTYQEYEVIKQMIKLAKQVNITICTDNLDFNTNPDIDIYYSNKITVKKLLNLVKQNNLKLEEPVELKNVYRLKTKELKHLSQNLYNPQSTKYAENVENLKLFLAKNEYSEIEEVAKQIKKLIRENKMNYHDISIITQNTENYASLVRAIFEQYDIPVFIDEKRDLNQNIIVQYVLSILEVIARNFTSESVFSYIKSGFLDIDKEEIFKLENYCEKWGIKLNKWKNDFTYELNDENKKQKIQRLNEIRKEIINPLLKLQQNIRKEKTAKNITKLLYEFLQEQKIEEKISQKINELEDKVDLASEYKTSYQIILNILDEIVLVFEEDKFSIEQYQKVLKVGLKNSGLGKIPGTADQVILGDVDRSRSHKVDIVFIIGINDGVFPSINKDEGFLDDADREILKNDGIELAKGTVEQLYEDKFNIYKAFTTAEKQIYLSYSSSDKD